MSGAGNDFLVVEPVPKGVNVKKLAPKACERTKGVGADGLLLLERSKKADYKMRIINADGSEAEMCGNGARCMAAYIVKNRKPRAKIFTMETLAGIIQAQAQGEVATVTLSDPKDYRANITLNLNGKKLSVSYIDTGVPHAIVYVHDLEKIDVAGIGPSIRHHNYFQPRGTNVDFVEIIRHNFVDCRTFERGVEGETKACGTGSVAAGIVSYLKANPSANNIQKAKMNVKTKSGEVLEVTFDITKGRSHNVQLKGSAKFIARGEYYV